MNAAHREPGVTLEHVLEIAARPEVVFSLWTSGEGLSRWWGVEAEVDPRAGGVIRVVLDGGPVMCGRFSAIEPPTRMVFSFGWETPPPGGPLPPGSTTVEIVIEPLAAGCRMVLRHHGLPLAQIGDHADGWSHFLGLLALIFEQGAER